MRTGRWRSDNARELERQVRPLHEGRRQSRRIDETFVDITPIGAVRTLIDRLRANGVDVLGTMLSR